MKLTKLQRHTAYILMLTQLECDSIGKDRKCFCIAAYDLFDIDFDDDIDGLPKMKDVFPELSKKKPKWVKTYWFGLDADGISKRIELLKQCIKQTA